MTSSFTPQDIAQTARELQDYAFDAGETKASAQLSHAAQRFEAAEGWAHAEKIRPAIEASNTAYNVAADDAVKRRISNEIFGTIRNQDINFSVTP